MSLWQILFVLFFVFPVVASFLGYIVEEVCSDDFMCTMFAILFAFFFAWFMLDCPGCEGQQVPHAVEGREEWVDLCYGTTYSQVERRTDEHD